MRLSFFSPIIFLLFLSCDKQNKSFSDNIISSEKELLMVTSLDIFSWINKMELSKSTQLSIDQRLMYNTFISSFDKESMGFDVKKRHKIFVIPETEKLNAGVFLAGDVTDINTFQNFLKDYFAVNSFSGSNPTTCYIEEFNVFIGFNEKSFVAGFSPSNQFAKEKVNSYLSTNFISLENTDLNTYLSQEDDFSFYLSTENLFKVLDRINNPIVKMQIPNFDQLKNYGSSVSMAVNFNVGDCSISLKSGSNDPINFKLYNASGVEDKYKYLLTDNDSLVMFGLMNINTESLNDQSLNLRSIGLLSDLNNILNSFNTDLNELNSTVDGQIAFSLIDFPNSLKDIQTNDIYKTDDDEDYWGDDEFDEFDNTEEFSNEKSIPTLLLNIGLKNQNKIQNIFNKNSIFVKSDSVIGFSSGIYLLIKENVLHISTSENLVNRIKNNGKLNVYGDIDQNSFREPVYGSILLNDVNITNGVIKKIFQEYNLKLILSEIQKLTFEASNSEGTVKVKMKNEDQNALKTIISIVLKSRLLETYI